VACFSIYFCRAKGSHSGDREHCVPQCLFVWKDLTSSSDYLSLIICYPRWWRRNSGQFTYVTLFLIHRSPCNFTYKYRLGSERLMDSASLKCIMFVLTPAQVKIEWFQTLEWSWNWNHSFGTARTDQCKIGSFLSPSFREHQFQGFKIIISPYYQINPPLRGQLLSLKTAPHLLKTERKDKVPGD